MDVPVELRVVFDILSGLGSFHREPVVVGAVHQAVPGLVRDGDIAAAVVDVVDVNDLGQSPDLQGALVPKLVGVVGPP